MRTLYYSPGACSLAPHILLEEIGEPFALRLVSTADGETRSAQHLRLNPKGRVPVLTCDDWVLTEAPALLFYLATSHRHLALLPESAQGQARASEWSNWLSGTVHSVAIKQVWRPETFSSDPLHHASIVASGKHNLTQAFDLIEARLAVSEWVVSNRYSYVDVYLLVFFRWGNRIGFDMRSGYPAWTRHTERISVRPAVGRALNTEQISLWV